MQEFSLYFSIGRDHILSWDALDHILFVAVLCLRYQFKDWKNVLVMITAFTIGHSITLALVSLGYISLPSHWVEFFIALTIVITAIDNIRQKETAQKSKLPLLYFFALFFGMIHGMGFAGTLMSLEGKTGLVVHLLAFNLGIEAAQILVVLVLLGFSTILLKWPKITRKGYILFFSGGIFALALKMAIERLHSITS
jgi:HupE / UreJ protein